MTIKVYMVVKGFSRTSKEIIQNDIWILPLFVYLRSGSWTKDKDISKGIMQLYKYLLIMPSQWETVE